MADPISDMLKEFSDMQLDDARPGAGSLGVAETDLSPSEFSRDNFHKITVLPDSKGRLVFIDGGNAAIFSSPGSCVHFVRIFHTTYEGGKRISSSTDEFYVLANSIRKDGNLVYSAKLFKSRQAILDDSFFSGEFLFDPLDRALLDGGSRFSISKVPCILRRMAELSAAGMLASSAGRGDIIMMDGDLSFRTIHEKKLIDSIRSRIERDGVVFLALSKTSNLLTSSGTAVAAFLNDAAVYDAWYYFPVAKPVSRGTKIFFVKLHPKSGHVFKLETFDLGFDMDHSFSALAVNSTDPIFLGYPYGLIEADMFARVSNKEQDYLRTVFISKAGKDWDRISRHERSLDAHSLLDKSRF